MNFFLIAVFGHGKNMFVACCFLVGDDAFVNGCGIDVFC